MVELLEFDEPTHTYTFKGKRVPSVTQILGTLHNFDGVPEGILVAAQERGTAVHLACEFDDHGDLDESSVDDKIVGYLAAWRKFRTEMRPSWLQIEARCFHPALHYAGTVDRVCLIDGVEWVIDIKTSIASHAIWGLQTAAYAQALNMANAKRGTVQLRNDGTYRLIEWAKKSDWATFVSLLTITNFLENNK